MKPIAGALTLTAVVIGLVLTPVASALPEMLGQGANATFTGSSIAENPTFETSKGEKIVCSAETIEGVQETDTLGWFHFMLTGCQSSGFKCNTTGDSTGTELILGLFHEVFDYLASGAELGVAMLVEPEETTIKCSALVTIKLKGRWICLLLNPLTVGTTKEYHCFLEPVEKIYWNDEGQEQQVQLLMSKNGGTFIETKLFNLYRVEFGAEAAFMNE